MPAEQIHRWRVLCTTESAYVHAWSEDKPTECPNDAGHTIVADATAIVESRELLNLVVDPVIEPVVPGSSKVVANDRPGIEIASGVTGFGSISTAYQHETNAAAKVCACLGFILKTSGTGSNVRIAARVKYQAVGEDTSGDWDDEQFVVVPVDFDTVGELFMVPIELDASAASPGDSVAIQIGRDGDNDMGAGTNDDVSVAIQIINLDVKAS